MKRLFKLLLFILLILPFGVFAKEKVPVYFFRGEGCPHCAEAEEYFKRLETTLGDKFEVKDYEVWYDKDNAKLMYAFSVINDEADETTGVPYIVIGDKSWIGYTEGFNPEFEAQINKVYEEDNRYDVMKIYEKEKDNEYSIYDFETGENNDYDDQDSYEGDFDFSDVETIGSDDEYLKPVTDLLRRALPILIILGVVGLFVIIGVVILIVVLVSKNKKNG